MKFKPFYFDGNLWFGFCKKPEDVKELLKYYDYNGLRRAKCRPTKGTPWFGYYLEYDSEPTLGEWIDSNKQNRFFDIKEERKLKLNKLRLN